MEKDRITVAQIGFRSLPNKESLGGIEVWVKEVGREMGGRGFEFLALTRKRYCKGGGSTNIKVRPISGIWTKNLETITHSLAATLYAVLTSNIVHYHGNLAAIWSFIPRVFRIPVVVTLHGADWERKKWGRVMKQIHKLALWITLRSATKICCVSYRLSQKLKLPRSGIIEFIPNGVNDDPVLPIAKDRNKVIYVGRIVPEKRIEDIIKAFGGINCSDLRLNIIGDAPYMCAYKKRLEQIASKDDRVKFRGALINEEKELEMCSASVLCLASEIEGMSLSVLEAARRNAVTICSDIPENRWLVEKLAQQKHLYLFPLGDFTALKDRLINALDGGVDQCWTKELGEYFSWGRVGMQYSKVYSECINENI